MGSPESLLQELSPFDSADIAAGVAALQLCPENADQLFQLEGAATVAGALAQKPDAPLMSASRWRRLFDDEQLGVISYANDPHTGPFVEEVAFVGGTYRVFGGSVDDSVFRLRRALDAIFRVSGPAVDPTVLSAAGRMVRTTLTVMDRTLRRAGLSRTSEAGQRFGDRVAIPEGERFRVLKRAVTVALGDEAEALDAAAVATLAALVIDQGSFPVQKLDPPSLIDGPLKTRPFLRANDKLIVANPGVLVGSLIHALVNLMIENGEAVGLADRFLSSTYLSAATSLQRLQLVEESATKVVLKSATALSSRWRMDTDWVCHVLTIADDFGGYDASDPYSRWSIPGGVDAVRAVCRDFERQLAISEPGTKVVHLVVVETLGRSLMLGLDGDLGSEGNLDLLLSAGDLETLSWLGRGDPLLILNYTRAHGTLVKQTKVLTFGALDLFHAWRAHHNSFYLGDDRTPNLLTLAPSAGACELRRELHRQRQVHGALWIDGLGSVEVQRADLASAAPIFAPTERHDQIALLVEAPNPVWVTTAIPREREGVRNAYLVVDALSYWVWQVARVAFGRELLSRLEGALVVRVDIEAPDTWSEWAVKTDVEPELCTVTANAQGVSLRVPRGMSRLFNRPDNLGERHLLTATLNGIRTVLTISGIDLRRLRCDDKALERLVDEVAPSGPKKKIVLLSLDLDSVELLESADLPSHRLVQDASISAILDAVGAHVRDDLGLEVGPIPDNKRVKVLGQVVTFLYEQLRAEVSQLALTGLLESMVARYERTVLERATYQLMVATRLACFSDFPNIVKKAEEELPALSRLALAQRFVIEYLAAQPTNGTLPLSSDRADLITALSLEISNYAMVSDAIHFQLSNQKMRILPSGRLGISRDQSYETAQSQFIAQSVASGVEQDLERFPTRWSDADPTEGQKRLAEQLDTAAGDEFGATFTELKMLLHTLIDIGQDDSVVVRPEADLIDKVAGRVGWPASRVAQILAGLTLEARPDFLKPKEPFTAQDVYPWVFNRRLSYLCRPLIRRQRGSITEIVYGQRHVGQAGPYLMTLCISGRLAHTRSQSMKSFIDHVRRVDTHAFNTRVADAFRPDRRLVVDQNVTKVLGKRVARPNGDDIGDLDVLVVDRGRRHVLVIETKDLGVSRTPREMENQLRATFDISGPKASDATRHLERVEWVRANLASVLDRYRVQCRRLSDWTVEGMFVVDQDLMTPYLANLPIKVISLRQLMRTGLRAPAKHGSPKRRR